MFIAAIRVTQSLAPPLGGARLRRRPEVIADWWRWKIENDGATKDRC
jgi:hypothetical protein